MIYSLSFSAAEPSVQTPSNLRAVKNQDVLTQSRKFEVGDSLFLCQHWIGRLALLPSTVSSMGSASRLPSAAKKRHEDPDLTAEGDFAAVGWISGMVPLLCRKAHGEIPVKSLDVFRRCDILNSECGPGRAGIPGSLYKLVSGFVPSSGAGRDDTRNMMAFGYVYGRRRQRRQVCVCCWALDRFSFVQATAFARRPERIGRHSF